jgi:type I restriction enzyme S subunit
MSINGWEIAPISDVLESEFPGVWGTVPNGQGTAKVLRSTNIDDDGHLDYEGGAERDIPTDKLRSKQLKSGDILLEASGGGPGKPVGRVAIFEPCDERTYLCSNFFRVLRPSRSVVPKYLLWRLLLAYQDPHIWAFQQQTTGIINLKTSEYLWQVLTWPPLPEQRRIAEILDTADRAIGETEVLISKLKQMKTGLLNDLLTRGLDEHGRLRNLEAKPEQFRYSVLGQIPREWQILPITSVAIQVPGSTTIGPFGSDLVANDYRTSGVPVVFVRDIRTEGFRWNSEVYVEPDKARQLSAHSVEPGDILATKMGLPPCISCVYPEWMPHGVVTADVIRLRANRRLVNVQWLSHFINSEAVAHQVRGITGGVTRPKVTLRDFRALRIALPSLAEQDLASQLIEIHEARIRAEEAYRDKLKVQKKGLMEDLLTGKVRVGV